MEVKIVCNQNRYYPQYATEHDACMDLKLRLDDSDSIKLDKGDNTITLQPGEVRIVGTGVQLAVPTEYVMLVFVRSSTGIKYNCQLANSTGVIDPGYRDEIKLALYNFGQDPITFVDGQRIAQFMIMPNPKVTLKRVEDDTDFRADDRGGGIGSTGA